MEDQGEPYGERDNSPSGKLERTRVPSRRVGKNNSAHCPVGMKNSEQVGINISGQHLLCKEVYVLGHCPLFPLLAARSMQILLGRGELHCTESVQR